MDNNKKGFSFNASAGGIIAILVTVVILAVAFVPTYTTAVDNAYSGQFECNDAVLDTLNTTANLCYNGTHMSETEAPTQAGLSTSQRNILLLGVTFVVIGGLVFAVKKTGLVNF